MIYKVEGLREYLDAYYAECRKRAEEQQRQPDERLRTDPATWDEWARLQQQHLEQKQRDAHRREQAKLAAAAAKVRAKIEREERARAKERVESLLRAKGVRINLEQPGDYDYGGSAISIEIDGELVIDGEYLDLNMIEEQA